MFKAKDITLISDDVYKTDSDIEIWSRYNHEEELQNMLDFCRLIKKAGLDNYLLKLFYDSKTSLCFITTTLDEYFENKNLTINHEDYLASEAIYAIALCTIEQFQIFNKAVGHQNAQLRKLFNVENLIQ